MNDYWTNYDAFSVYESFLLVCKRLDIFLIFYGERWVVGKNYEFEVSIVLF